MTARVLLVVSVAWLLSTASVPGQGRIAFANTSQSRLFVSHPGINGGLPVVLGTASLPEFGFGPASVEIRLYAGLTSNSLSPVLIGTAANQTFVLNTASTIASAQGTFAGGNPLALPGFDGSAPVYLQFTVRGPPGYANNSPIILVNLATGAAPSTTVFAQTADASHWGPMVIPAFPEPSALALTGLSFGVMFFARRKVR